MSWYFIPLSSARYQSQRGRDVKYLVQLLASRNRYATTNNLLLRPERYFRYDRFSDAGAQIRLIEFRAEPVSNRIHLRMTVHDITSLPYYTAISYEWGTSRGTHLILVDGWTMPTGENCHRVLRQSRNQCASVYYWIDAICVDQWHNAEKSKQVQLMSFVYRNAQSTAVCIGEHVPLSAFLYRHLEATVEARAFSLVSEDRIINAAENVCARSYFRRLWIVQEILLSKEIKLYCGDDILAWSTLREFTVGDGKNDFVRGDKCSSYIKLALSRMRGTLTTDWRLEELVDGFAGQECSDTRDKIYGMLGLPSMSGNMANALPLTPDYDLPIIGTALEVIRFYRYSTSADTFTKACREVVEALEVEHHDSAVQALLKRSNNELRFAIAEILEHQRQQTWHGSPAAHRRLASLVERHFAIRRVGESAYRQADLRRTLANTNYDGSATTVRSSQRTPRFVDLIPDNMDSASARYRLSNLYRLALQCPIVQSEPHPRSKTPASHDQMICTCLQDCSDMTRREGADGAGGGDLCLYVDAEDILAQMLHSLKAERQASTDRTKLASNAYGLQSGEKVQQSNNRDPSV
ncbi:hypothetical protein LTR78_005235 [Recurvomyces mirabilis]|uniref:Heterokaryon incompatibility domain-containing protein n=1 Tax=Recurvomyces mirabilis TaxID=574656 RepID=A0AAE1C1M2_9PEZI|nr:hypothetical protein LTR78_005235 [Recurvomyces mirabilis]KAK5157785.1 hypothetical protein LTS14_003707 [Recurvomyces mirabilis]